MYAYSNHAQGEFITGPTMMENNNSCKKQHVSFFLFQIQFQAVYNSGKATIQARLIILELTRILASHRWRFAMNLNMSGASDSFFFQWCPNLEEAEDAARYCAIILSRWGHGTYRYVERMCPSKHAI